MTEARLKLLVYKFLSESLTEAEKTELFAAAEEHPEIWDLIRKLQDTEQLLKDLKEIQIEEDSKAKIITLRRMRIAAAACFLIAVIAGGFLYFRHKQSTPLPLALGPSATPVEYKIDSTEHGRSKQIALPDGTRVSLSSATKIRYPVTFSGAVRTVEIKGEAYFDISKDPGRPFHVKADSLSIEVLGTRFDVRAYAGEPLITTTVTDGAVKVLFNGNMQTLHPKDQLTVTSSTGKGLVYRNVDTSLSTSWTHGKFRFVHADVPTVMRELGSWYGVHFDIRVAPNTCTIDGPFNHNLPLREILQAIQQKDLRFDFKGDTIIVH